ncbi:hypothetical protein COLO4_18458 [Corchorus olitorius]|uniref:Uncharacterized protein n=1 Tax=Corchorus olitorius TaxID=93759 RepID=A0A1R3J932_9ROSI|nr:hypothetical protein COLO4_18458 [Corchorus olitorius]
MAAASALLDEREERTRLLCVLDYKGRRIYKLLGLGLSS